MHWQWQFMLCLLKHTNSLHTAKMGAFWRSVLVPSVLSSALLCRLLYLMKCANTESRTLKFSTVLHCVDCSVTLKRVPLDFQFRGFWCSDLLDAGFICLLSADLLVYQCKLGICWRRKEWPWQKWRQWLSCEFMCNKIHSSHRSAVT